MAGYEGMSPEFRRRLEQMVAASGGRLSIISGHRSRDRQEALWTAAVRKYGSATKARKYVARPGSSNHEHGEAADLKYANAAARQWAHANAKRFGLHFPMGHEPWHIERVDLKSKKSAYTTPPGMGGSGTKTGDSIDAFMGAVRQVESGGNYKAVGPMTRYGRATGAYQFINSTWGNYKGYREARDAPPEIQDERARQLMGRYFAEYGDARLVAIAWNGGPGAVAKARKGQSVRDSAVNSNTFKYADKVLAAMGRGGHGSHAGHSHDPKIQPGVDAISDFEENRHKPGFQIKQFQNILSGVFGDELSSPFESMGEVGGSFGDFTEITSGLRESA